MRSQKGIRFKAEDNFRNICNTTKPVALLSPEGLNCMDKSQCSTNQRKEVLFHLEPNDEYTISERNFVDDGVLPEKELRRSDRVRTRRRIYDAESGTYKPV